MYESARHAVHSVARGWQTSTGNCRQTRHELKNDFCYQARWNKPTRPGRRSVLTDEHLSFIETNTLADATLSDGRMAVIIQQRFNISVSRSRITRVRKELGFSYRPPLVKQELTVIQEKERVEFCHWALSNRDKIPCIVFSDESRFQLGPDNYWGRIRRGEPNEVNNSRVLLREWNLTTVWWLRRTWGGTIGWWRSVTEC